VARSVSNSTLTQVLHRSLPGGAGPSQVAQVSALLVAAGAPRVIGASSPGCGVPSDVGIRHVLLSRAVCVVFL